MAEEQPTIPTQTPNPYVNAQGKPNARSRAGNGGLTGPLQYAKGPLGMTQVVQDISTAGLPKLNAEKKPSVSQEVNKAGLQRRFMARAVVAPKTVSGEVYSRVLDSEERMGRQQKLNDLFPTANPVKTPEEKQHDAEAAQAHHEVILKNFKSRDTSLIGGQVPRMGISDGHATQYDRLVAAGQIKPMSAAEGYSLPSEQEVERNRQAGEANRTRMEQMTSGGGDGDWSKSRRPLETGGVGSDETRTYITDSQPTVGQAASNRKASEKTLARLRARAEQRIQGQKDEAKAARAAKKTASAPVATPADADKAKRNKTTGKTTKAVMKEAVGEFVPKNSKKR